MKRNFFHIPSFVYKKAETGASSGTPEAPKPPEAPRPADVTRNNDNAATGLKNAIAPTPPAHPDEKPKPPKPAPEDQARINQTVPASGEPDMRNFNLHPRPVAPNRTPTSPVKLGKIDGRGHRVPTTGETPAVRSEPPETPNKPRIAPDETPVRTQEEQDRINKTVPASGEVDRRDFRVRRATPVTTNAPQAAPRKIVKINGGRDPAPTTQDTPPTPANQEREKERPQSGTKSLTPAHNNPPDTSPSGTPKPPEKRRDPNSEYATYHRADGTQETVSRRYGGAWRTERGVGIVGQDQNIRPETPRNNPAPETPAGTPPTADKPNKQRPFTPGKAPEKPIQTPPAEPDQNFNKLDFSGTTSPYTTQGNAPSENTTTHPTPTNDANKEPPKPTTPEKNQNNRTFEEESADFQTRMERGEYHINNQFTDAGREHLRRVDALRPAAPATPGTEEKDKIPEAQPSTGDAKATPTQPSSATEASEGTPPIENKPPLPVDTEQSNEAVITVNGKSIPLTRESPDAAWRDRDGVPYGDDLVAGSMKKDNAEKTQETKTASVPTKPPVSETPTTQPNTPVNPPESDKKDTKKPPESNTPPPTEPVPRDAEEAQYLQKEKDFKKNLDSGKYTQYNTQKGREEFTPEGRKAFRELTSSTHRYIPGAIFSRASDSFFKVPGAAGELHDRGEENSFLKNRAQQRELAQTPSETTIVRAERHKSSLSKNNVENGGEEAINFDMSKGVVSGDDPDLSVERWRTYDYNKKQNGYPRLTVFSQEKDMLGKPQFASKVMHPNDPATKELEKRIAEGGQFPNLYTAEMDVFGNGKPQKVYLMPNEHAPNRLSMGDGPASPSKIGVLKEKKPEKKEEIKRPELPKITYY